MDKDRENDFVMYDSLTEGEANELRIKCVNDILPDKYNECNIDGVLSCCSCWGFTNNENDSLCTDTVLRVMDYLKSKSDTPKIFYGNHDEEAVQRMYEEIQTNDNIQIETINVYLVAQGFIRYVRNNSIPFLPKNVHETLFESYLKYDASRQKEIIKRIPFILNRRNRTFLITLIELFKSIDEKKKYSETSKSDLLHIFGPIIFKGTYENKQVHGYHRMVILQDLMDSEFKKVDKGFFF
ncbi:hypothetical protein P3W45_001182 [Vairimorpha bombi]|jgi:hypothetical protein